MPLPTGAISFSDINTELRRTSTAQLSMSDDDFRGLAGQDGTGQIDMLNCRGKSIVGRGTGQNITLNNSQFGDGNQSAAWWWGGNGVHQIVNNGSFTNVQRIPTGTGLSHRWAMLFLSNLGNDYQIRATQTSGSGGTINFGGGSGSWSNNTWTTIGSSSRSLSLNSGIGSSGSRTFTISIRELSTSTVVASSSNTLDVFDTSSSTNGGSF